MGLFQFITSGSISRLADEEQCGSRFKSIAYASDYFTKQSTHYSLSASICAKAHCSASILTHNLSVSVL